MIIIAIVILVACLWILKYIFELPAIQKLFVRSVELIIASIVCYAISQVFCGLVFLVLKKDIQQYLWLIHIFLFIWFYFNSKEFNKKYGEDYE